MMIEACMRWKQRMAKPEQVTEFRKNLHLAHCVDVSNVRTLIWSLEGTWNLKRDFPCLASPWPVAWMEYELPVGRYQTDGMVGWGPVPGGKYSGRVGAMGIQIEFSPPMTNPVKIIPWMSRNFEAKGTYYSDMMTHVLRAPEEDQIVRWLQSWELFIQLPDGLRCMGNQFFWLRQDGGISAYGVTGLKTTVSEKALDDDVEEDMMVPILYGLSLLHCKNTRLVDRNIERHEAKRLERAMGMSVSLKELRVQPLKLKSVYEQTEPKGGTKKRMHICRGHFRDYRAGKGLFGKYHGIYWCAQHLRGDVARGMVLKDYEIDPSWN